MLKQRMAGGDRYTAIVASPIGPLGFKLQNQALVEIQFLPSKTKLVAPKTSLAKKVAAQFQRYFRNPKYEFNLPLMVAGTAFQQRVWQAMQTIPVGETRSYGEIAALLKTSPRAVGNACRANPLPLVIPCHRITARFHLGGFAGHTQGWLCNIKTWLLAHEKAL